MKYTREHPKRVVTTAIYPRSFRYGSEFADFTGVIKTSDNSFGYYQNGVLHRTDGPASEWSNGNKGWWIEGLNYSEDQYRDEIKRLGLTTSDYFKNML